jgi:RecA/RadA recombinase
MARRRQTRENQWEGERREGSIDAMFGSIRDQANEKLGRSDISLGTESENVLVGLPLPALALRYLFQSTVYPLSRITQITGEEGSCKSSLLYEIFRWHMVYGGGACFIENELKDSPELRHSILQWNPTYINRTEVCKTHSLEEWQKSLTTFLNIVKKTQDDRGGPGRTIPVAFGIDSLMATGPEEEIKKILKEGHASRNFALAALLISQYMKTMPEQIRDYPVSIIGTNHLKPATDYMGRPTANIPGGKSVKFMETYEIEMKRAPSADINLVDYGGIKLKLTARKNSLGPSRKQIGAELLWWYEEEPETGLLRQQTAWDWDTASVELLLSFGAAGSGKKTIYNRLMDVCHIQVTSIRDRLAICRDLGITEPVHYRVIGAALERRPDILANLYPVLSILPRRSFQPGIDYTLAREQAIAEGEQQAESLYENIDNLPTPDADVLDPTGSTVLPDDVEEDPSDGVAV